MQHLPCVLCRKGLDKRIDKNRKPYFICDECGMQIFVRGKRGIQRLEQLLGGMNKRRISRN